MSDEAKIQLRLPLDVRDWVARKAEQELRSMNAQIVYVLRQLMTESNLRKNAGESR
ncbi:Arc family DNA-binding protein [Burkholderia gladioli]|uniref:Arc family DNA-binding protein n=1 Tax=Burkholderia gladioli TaxID=28095 RepID=UPI0016414DD6|nr:Arc family DNA-binding protein [Burkholderia gladioli]